MKSAFTKSMKASTLKSRQDKKKMAIYQAVDHLDDNQIDKISVIIENPDTNDGKKLKAEIEQEEEKKYEGREPTEEECLAILERYEQEKQEQLREIVD